MNKNCFKCSSNSTILDGKNWVCAQHVDHCNCSKDHMKMFEWDYSENRDFAIPITVLHMEGQYPPPEKDEYTSTGQLRFFKPVINSNTHDFRVRWADGGKDDSDKCDECGSRKCLNPVHKDYYKTK